MEGFCGGARVGFAHRIHVNHDIGLRSDELARKVAHRNGGSGMMHVTHAGRERRFVFTTMEDGDGVASFDELLHNVAADETGAADQKNVHLGRLTLTLQRCMGMEPKRIRWMAWWYTAIAIGFALLAADHIVTGDKAWLIAVRVVIAAGFGFLAYLEFRGKTRKR